MRIKLPANRRMIISIGFRCCCWFGWLKATIPALVAAHKPLTFKLYYYILILSIENKYSKHYAQAVFAP